MGSIGWAAVALCMVAVSVEAEAKKRRGSASSRPRASRSASYASALSSAVYYPSCAAARAAGAAPVRVGSPGYSRRLDRDGDGVGCE